MKNLSFIESLALVLYMVIFLGEAWFVSVHSDLHAFVISHPWLILAYGFAAFRAGRSISYNLIGKPVRDVVDIQEVPDSSQAGDSAEPNQSQRGVIRTFAELICCPICTTTHSAMLLLTTSAINLTFGLVLTSALAAAGVAESVHWWAENQEWAGRSHREDAGYTSTIHRKIRGA